MSDRGITTQLVDENGARLLLEDAELRVDSGPSKGVRHPIGLHSIVIGSAPECHLVLRDPTVSARHAEISLGRNGHTIRDLGAKNGTRVGGVLVERAPLTAAAKLQLGTTKLSVHVRGSTTSIALSAPGVLGNVVAHSVAMRAVMSTLEQLAPSDTTILIEGETGTGKEVTAQLLHALSPRRDQPFVVFDCGAIAANLIAAELFGVERGAFTDAVESRAGLFEAAEGGTLFLDEVGEMPLDVQPAMLRALEARRTRRIGGRSDTSHDVRIIAATNRNLAEEVRAGRFRADLYYRLAVAPLRLPPLRERREDITVLARQFAGELGLELPGELLAALESHDWPGNIRELRNAIERANFRHGREALHELAAAAQRRAIPPLAEARRQASDTFEREYLAAAIAASDGNLSRAAELAGVSRQQITLLVKKHGMRVRDRES